MQQPSQKAISDLTAQVTGIRKDVDALRAMTTGSGNIRIDGKSLVVDVSVRMSELVKLTAFAANKFPARDSSDAYLAAHDITDFALSMLDDSDAATVRATIGALAVGGTAADSDKLDGQHGSYYAIAGAAPAAHQLDGALHTVSGVTAGHFLKALSPTTFGFAAHGLTYADVGAAPASHALDSATHTIGSLTNLYVPFASSSGNVLQNSMLYKATSGSFTGIGLSQSSGAGVDPMLINPKNIANYALIQFAPASGTNVNCSFAVMPKGTGVTNNVAQFTIFGTDYLADSVNYEFLTFRATGSLFYCATGKAGTGTARPMMFATVYAGDYVTNANQLYLATDGKVGVGRIPTTCKFEVAGNQVVYFVTGVAAPGQLVQSFRDGSYSNYGWDVRVEGLATGDLYLQRTIAGVSTTALQIARASGQFTMPYYSTAGILHNSAAGLISTSLVVAADIGAVVNTSVIPKGGAANASLVASSITDDGTTVKTTKALGVGTSSTPTTAGVIRCDTGIGVGIDPDSNWIVNIQKDQNAHTSLSVANANDHASAYGRITVWGNTNYLSLISTPALGTYLGTAGLSGIACVNTAGFQLRNISNTDMTFKTNDTVRMTIAAAGYVSLHVIHAGATQAAAGAAANEIWKTSGHATLPDNVLMIGV
jgi:hypothetical protein